MKIPKQWKHWCKMAQLSPSGGYKLRESKYGGQFRGRGRRWRTYGNKIEGFWFEASEIYETFDRWANSGAACFPLPQTVWEFGAIIAEMDHRKAVEQYMWNDNECNPLRKVL